MGKRLISLWHVEVIFLRRRYSKGKFLQRNSKRGIHFELKRNIRRPKPDNGRKS